MAEAWTVSRTANGINVIDENGLPVCTRVGLDDANLIASAPRVAEQVKLLREALEASKSRMEIAAEYLHRFQGACAYHGDQLVGAIKRIDATLEATKEEA